MDKIVHVPAPSSSTALADVRPDLADEADEFAKASLADNTRKALRHDWAVFTAWCATHQLQPLPASIDTVAGFFAEQARSKKVATLTRYRATITKMHKLAGHVSPFADERLRSVMEGIKRKKGVQQTRKAPMTHEIAASIENVRDRAIVLLGLTTALRGDNLCLLDVEDLTFVDAGIIIDVRKSKTDQQRQGFRVAVPRLENPAGCPVAALEAWLSVLGETEGPLFRGFLCNGKLRPAGSARMTPATVWRIVKDAAEAAGFDPKAYGAHSMRSGYVTKAREQGQDWHTIMEQTGHKRVETVKKYDRGTIDPFKASKVAEVFGKKKGEK